ncbi:glycoside hydrolase superfamily [Xylariales sp. PMI_506]|nr:glycoside hydrolase superfamily [Xylariales sp. PMI_506]
MLTGIERLYAQAQREHRRALIDKRAILTVTDASVSQETERPEVIVYVDELGHTISVAEETVVIMPAASPSSSPSSRPAPSLPLVRPPPPSSASEATSSAAVPPAGQPSRKPAAAPAPPVAAPSRSPKAPKPDEPSAPATSNLQGGAHGITYSPYKANGDCKSADDVATDFGVFANNYNLVRVYGVDCNQVSTTYSAAKQHGNKLMLGMFDIDNVPASVAAMATGINNDWSMVDTVSVGNEMVNDGKASPSQMINAVKEARSALRAAGFNGPVVTVDTFNAAISNPELCDESDYCAVNVHPFFDPNTSADQAGSFVSSTIENLRSKLANSNQRIVVTETGWPWQGDANGNAVPSIENQSTAVSSIKGVCNGGTFNCIVFNAFNDLWKQANPSTFNAEQYWGLGGANSPTENSSN